MLNNSLFLSCFENWLSIWHTHFTCFRTGSIFFQKKWGYLVLNIRFMRSSPTGETSEKIAVKVPPTPFHENAVFAVRDLNLGLFLFTGKEFFHFVTTVFKCFHLQIDSIHRLVLWVCAYDSVKVFKEAVPGIICDIIQKCQTTILFKLINC